MVWENSYNFNYDTSAFLLILLNLVEMKRNENANMTEGFWNSLLEFFYAQGVSVNVIGYTISLSEQIPNKIYSIGPIIEFIKFNIWGTLFEVKGLERPKC